MKKRSALPVLAALLVGSTTAGVWLARAGWALVVGVALVQAALTAAGWRASIGSRTVPGSRG